MNGRFRFCFGASGAGKSETLLQEVIGESIRLPDTMFFIVVPDQYTMQVQRDVLRMHPRHAIMNIDVLSFSRLRYRVFDEVGEPDVPILDDMGKTLILRHVAEEIADRLPVIGRRLSQPGFLDEVKSTLSEFLQYCVSPEDLEKLIGVCGLRGQLAARLRDLQTLYGTFLHYIEGHYLAAEETMTALAERIPRSALLRDSVVVFDGFTGFTPIQYQVLLSILQTARCVTISLLADPDEDPCAIGRESVFSLTGKTVRDLMAMTGDARASLSPAQEGARPDIFIRERPVKRLRDNPPLAFLEHRLFREDGEVYREAPGKALVLFEAADPQEECVACCRRILQWIRSDASLRFEDIAVLCTDPGIYGPLMDRTAAQFDIPIYLDETRKLGMNPLVELVESAMEIVRGGFAAEAVFRFLRCPLTGFAPEAVDRLQLYVQALGIRGRKRWTERFLRVPGRSAGPEELAALLGELNTLRERFVQLILPLCEVGAQDVRSFSESLVRLFTELEVEGKLKLMASQREAAGDDRGRREAEQIYGKIIGLIDQMVALLGTQRVSVREYGELLRVGIDKISIGMIPGGIDRVMVGDRERTRLGEKKLLFFLGVNDSLMARADGGGLISEIDRQFLMEAQTGVELAPNTAQSLANEREYLYMILTRPSRGLYLSWSLMGMDGKGMRPADLVRRVRQLFPALTVERTEDGAILSLLETKGNARALVAERLRGYADARLGEEQEEELLSLVSALCERDAESRAWLGRLTDAAFYRYRSVRLNKTTSDILYGERQEDSVSRLELFAGCPYAHFADYGLRLREEERYVFGAADLGTILHASLERMDRQLRSAGGSWLDFSVAEAERMVDAVLVDCASGYRNELLLSNNRYRYMLTRMRRVLLRTVDTVQYQLRKGAFVPAAAEWDFREQEGSLILRGRVDRIDICGEEGRRYFRIVDFKSGARTWDPTLFIHGLQLQLMLYLSAVSREERRQHPEMSVTPAGVFYYHVSDPMISADGNKIADDIQNEIRRKLAFKGVANSDLKTLQLMDRELSAGVRSDVLPVGIKRDGNFTASSRVFSTELFALASRHVDRTIRSFDERICGGEIAVSPWRYEGKTACDHCGYRGVCGFDRRIPGYLLRELKSLDEAQVRERMLHE